MLPWADAPGRRPAPALASLILAAVLALQTLAAAQASAREPDSYLDSSPAERRERVTLFAAGLELPVVGSESVRPQLAGFRDVFRSLQLGLKARFDPGEAASGYDYIPQVGFHLRKLWLSDEDTSTVRNSEYISVVAGAYPAYDFQNSARAGPKPFIAVELGKYWMPFDNQPYGLDFCVDITRYFDGYPPNNPRNHLLGFGINLYHVIKL